MSDKINIPETDGEYGVGYEPEDADGNNIPDGAEQKASGAKYDSVREAYRSTDGFLSGVGEVIRSTALGQNTVGRVAGIGLNILEIVFPIGKVSKLREAGKKALNLNKDKNDMKDAIKRAFTRDGGSFFRVRDEDGNISTETILASLIRGLLIVGVLYVAHLAGVLSEAMKVFSLS